MGPGSEDQHGFVEAQPFADVRDTRAQGALYGAGGHGRWLGEHGPFGGQVVGNLEEPRVPC